ncbi:hypothetical protein GCM10027187_48520 [Streptosporangium sandarakinum]
MANTPCIHSPRSPAPPKGWVVIILLLLLSFAAGAHVLGMSAELIALLITTVIGATVKLAKALLHPQRHGSL